MDHNRKTNPYRKPRMLRISDVFIIIVLLIASIIFIPFIHSKPGNFVEVYKSDDVIAKYPLNEDRFFSIEGLRGTVGLEIKNNRVKVHSSPCPQQICVETGWISKTYEQIICAPNLIFVTVTTKRENESIDALTR